MEELLKAQPLSVALLAVVLLIGLITWLIKRKNHYGEDTVITPGLMDYIDKRAEHKVRNLLTEPTFKLESLSKSIQDHEERLRLLEKKRGT